MTDRYWDRIRKIVRQIDDTKRGPVKTAPISQPQQQIKLKPRQPTKPVDTKPADNNPISMAEKLQIIEQAGANNELISMTYNGVTRLVEPYSYRERFSKEANTFKQYFYGWCLLHNEIHSFKPELITDVKATGTTFSPDKRGFINEFAAKAGQE